jgi:hypothetical protein
MTSPRARALALDRNFALLEAAAVAGERCPQTSPHGPIDPGAISELFKAGRIRSEVYVTNYRVVTILVGPHAGKSTARLGPWAMPWRIDGVMLKHLAEAEAPP